MAVTSEIQLKVSHLNMAFGGVQALWEVSFEVKKGEIFSIIGPNGAGKTVLLNCINGLYHPQQGRILFEGKEITKAKPYQRAKMGISEPFRRSSFSKGRPFSTISASAATFISRRDFSAEPLPG